MKFEKRGEITPEEAAAAKTAPPADGKQKPVLLYLIILFAIAFVLILCSFVMHQRSNAEVLKELQSQVDTLQQLQEVEEKYEDTLSENQALQDQVEALSDQAAEASRQQQAMELLWKLEQLYLHESDLCADVLAQLQEDDLYLSLPTSTVGNDAAYETPRAVYNRIATALESASDDAQ